MNRKISLLSILIFIFIILNIFSLNTKAAEVVRVGGKTRIETANYLANKEFTKANTVILVNGWGYADAVSAVPLSKKLQAPILLTQNIGSLEKQVQSIIENLQVKNVIIIGGQAVVSEEIESKLKIQYKVKRICGTVDTTRMGTNAAVAYEVLKDSKVNAAILVNGQDGYADALTVSSISASKGYPVLFTKSKELPSSITNVIERHNLKILAVGGKGVLSDSVLSLVKGERIAWGKDRFETNLSLLNWADTANFSNMYVAAGGRGDKEFADGLVAASAAAKNYAPLILSGLGASDYHIQEALKYINNNVNRKSIINIIGGEGSVNSNIEQAIKNIVYNINNPDLSEVKKVEAITKVVDFKDYGVIKLKLKVNGIEITIEDLNKCGYSAEFQSDKNIFYEGSLSKNGEISKDKLRNIYNSDESELEDFSYKVVIKKSNAIIAESEIISVNIIDGEFTAKNINEYSLKLVDKSENSKVKSGKVVVGEKLNLYDVIGDTVNGRINADITDYITLESSNYFVASIDGKTINALSPGEVIITIKSGIVEKKFNLIVLDNNEENKRKIFKVEPEINSIKFAKGGYRIFKLNFKDQYGDEFLDAENGIDKDFYVKKFIQDSRDNIIANVEVTYKSYEVYIKIQASDNREGNGYLNIYNSNGAVINKIFVDVGKEMLFDYIKLEREDGTDKELVLDINPEVAKNDDKYEIKLKLNEYTKSGLFIRTAEGNNQELKTKDGKHIFNLKINSGDKIIPYILKVQEGIISVKLNRKDVSIIEEGELAIEINENGMNKAIRRISVTDSSPKITEGSLKNNVEANSLNIPIYSIVDYYNIKIDKICGDGKVKISKDGIIYIETNLGKDYYNYNCEEDIYLGKLVCSIKDGNIIYNNISEGYFNFIVRQGQAKGEALIGILRLHEYTPFQSSILKIIVENI